MFMVHIGTGGWAYFHGGGRDPLAAYARAFHYVEVNSTFYTTPSITTVRSWRRRVPRDFVFSVRCHRDLTHRYQLSPYRESFDILARSIRICSELRAEVLHIQTPPSFNPDVMLGDIRDLFSSFDLENLRVAWELRGRSSERTFDLMRDLGIIHCTDISRDMPSVESDVLYTRLFGHGKHTLYQFDDDELLQIDARIKETNPRKAYATFHGVKMYLDAARFKVYAAGGTFPNTTGTTGLASLKTVLEEDAQFPATRDELIEKQGWKVVDLTDTERVHARIFLEKLPEKRKYAGIEDVLRALQPLV